MDPVEAPSLHGNAGQGALEFEPATGARRDDGTRVDIARS